MNNWKKKSSFFLSLLPSVDCGCRDRRLLGTPSTALTLLMPMFKPLVWSIELVHKLWQGWHFYFRSIESKWVGLLWSILDKFHYNRQRVFHIKANTMLFDIIIAFSLPEESVFSLSWCKASNREVIRFVNTSNKLQDAIPILLVALRIMLIILIIVAIREKSFSKLKLIKRYLQSLMTEILWLFCQ